MTNLPPFTEYLAKLRAKLSKLLPDFEIEAKAELAYQIEELKLEKNAIILGHNYMEPALYHSIPDFKGDSLELARVAASADCDVIVFCGVEFMAESAKLLNPKRTVLLPAEKAGCSLAASITAEDVRNLRATYPGLPIMTYINTYADVKAESDICCTSGNALKVLESFGESSVIFLPDQYLAANLAKESGRSILFAERNNFPDPSTVTPGSIVGWKGRCEVHEKFTVKDVENAREQFSDLAVLAHPESPPEVIEQVDFSGGTSAMIKYVQRSEAKNFLLLTECSMGDNIIAENPGKEMLRLCSFRCPHMNEITLEGVLHSLTHNKKEIFVPSAIAQKASEAVERMLSI